MNNQDNTTHQLHYSAGYLSDDATTQGQAPVPPPPVSPAAEPPTTLVQSPMAPELAGGRVPPAGPPVSFRSETAGTPMRKGHTTIADEVVERIIQRVVERTVDEVEGVQALRPGVGKHLGEGEQAADRAVAVELTDGAATISVAVEVQFGYAVHEVLDQVRTTVIDTTERLLGLTVAEFNAVVTDVAFDESGTQ